ncbi:radial spoke head 1 homolog [Hydractinia symbiolongicarpus]|uniref:radial spoke head 1 homolog n=1 Tax=Hydractinia symbiolongicarpus TaxID=13093 RepID=UPI00254A814E|nr:radial spoke head 1 homolog [Hydractinia symbiolongicarpus]
MSDDEDFPEEELNLGHYEGERNESDQRHGFGKAYFPNGDVYEGAYENGKRHGKGLYKFANGCRYDGSYLWNRRDGEGVMIFPDGSKYEGNWSEDCRHGNGKYYYVNGDTYDGEWSKNLKNGQGTYTDNQTNSETRGFWHHGKLHGLVKITLGDHIYEGSYDKTAVSFTD